MSVSLLEQSYDRSRNNDLAAFRAAQMLGGGGSDPFMDGIEGSWYTKCFEYMPRAIVPSALKAIAARKHKMGCIEIRLTHPTVDEKLKGRPDALCSDDPAFWVAQALEAGIPVIRYIVEPGKRLAINW